MVRCNDDEEQLRVAAKPPDDPAEILRQSARRLQASLAEEPDRFSGVSVSLDEGKVFVRGKLKLHADVDDARRRAIGYCGAENVAFSACCHA